MEDQVEELAKQREAWLDMQREEEARAVEASLLEEDHRRIKKEAERMRLAEEMARIDAERRQAELDARVRDEAERMLERQAEQRRAREREEARKEQEARQLLRDRAEAKRVREEEEAARLAARMRPSRPMDDFRHVPPFDRHDRRREPGSWFDSRY